MTPSILVSIHDVAPPFEREVRELWAICFAHGVRPALCVAPPRRFERPLQEQARFGDWLFARADQGARVFLQGELEAPRPEARHDASAAARSLADRGCVDRTAARRTAGIGELLLVGHARVRERIAEGIHALLRCGVSPLGFVPANWQARAETRQAAREEGLTLLEDTRFLWRLADEAPIAAPLVRWEGFVRSGRYGSPLVASHGRQTGRSAPLIRVALRPRDLSDSSSRASLASVLERWTKEGAVTGYSAFAHRWPMAQRTAA